MVEHNCHIGCVKQFGMLSCCHTSKIVLKSPLTPQTVALKNGGGGNFGGFKLTIVLTAKLRISPKTKCGKRRVPAMPVRLQCQM